MKLKNTIKNKFARRTLANLLTVAVILAVLLLNVGVSALFGYQLWHTDNTSHELYTLTDTAVNYLKINLDEVNAQRPAEDPVKVDIIFCAKPDALCANERMKLVYYTALEMEKAFRGTIKVSSYDVQKEPDRIRTYLSTIYSTIDPDDVIVASGSEFRVISLRSMYVYDTVSALEPWAYDAEKVISRAIVAITRARSPICGFLMNHGEAIEDAQLKDSYTSLEQVIREAGYDVVRLNLATEEIPKDCRLLISVDPQSDFTNTGERNELQKLDEFLAASNSLMFFVDADTPKLSCLEEFLEEWGIVFGRASAEGVSGTMQAVDPEHALDSTGRRIVGSYETAGFAGSVFSGLIEQGKPNIVFDNALPILPSPTYESGYISENIDAGEAAYTLYSYNRNGVNRIMYDMFRTGSDSYAYLKSAGEWVRDGEGAYVIADNSGLYRLMTMTAQNRSMGEGKGYTVVNDASYVCAVGSTEMAKNAYLDERSCGNSEALLALMRAIGHEVVTSGVPLKLLPTTEANDTYCTPFATTVWTVVLVLVPAAAAVCTAVPLLLRRRHAH